MSKFRCNLEKTVVFSTMVIYQIQTKEKGIYYEEDR